MCPESSYPGLVPSPTASSFHHRDVVQRWHDRPKPPKEPTPGESVEVVSEVVAREMDYDGVVRRICNRCLARVLFRIAWPAQRLDLALDRTSVLRANCSVAFSPRTVMQLMFGTLITGSIDRFFLRVYRMNNLLAHGIRASSILFDSYKK